LVDLIFAERQQALANIRSEIAAGNHSWVDYWRESRGEERAQADDAWLEQHRDALVDAIGGRSLRTSARTEKRGDMRKGSRPFGIAPAILRCCDERPDKDH
jgi:hypothetical protein